MEKLILNFIAFLSFTQIVLVQSANKKVLCYFDSGNFRTDESEIAKMSMAQLKNALGLCTHLVYGYVGIRPKTYNIFNVNGDSDEHYRTITSMKSEHPHLKVYLSLGGDKDHDNIMNNKYIKFLEGGSTLYENFIKSSIKLLKENGFDGLDLAFQLPRNEPQKAYSGYKSSGKYIPEPVFKDNEQETHNNQFTEFVAALHKAYKEENLKMILTVLPNVNSSSYYNISVLHNKFEYINLFTFDFLTPHRNPNEIDYTANIYSKDKRYSIPQNSIDFQVQHWINNGCPKKKLILGVATYARTWTVATDTVYGATSIPVITYVEGPAAAGLYSKIEGLLSRPEVCRKLKDGNCTEVVKRKYGNYAVCPQNKETMMYISYDGLDFVATKARYAKRRGLGGVAIYDINHDDFAGHCNGVKFIILNSINLETDSVQRKQTVVVKQPEHGACKIKYKIKFA